MASAGESAASKLSVLAGDSRMRGRIAGAAAYGGDRSRWGGGDLEGVGRPLSKRMRGGEKQRISSIPFYWR